MAEKFYVFRQKDEWVVLRDEEPLFCFVDKDRKVAVAKAKTALIDYELEFGQSQGSSVVEQ